MNISDEGRRGLGDEGDFRDSDSEMGKNGAGKEVGYCVASNWNKELA